MNRLKVTKIGLLNFWLYDEEEYDFYGGKLILRGTNGSGKSVTMQSFIPLILDGNKSPDRLDPFGSKERKIEDYIIGDSESVQKEEAISYLYMETYNKEQNKYITVGLGFRGRKGRGVDSWGFSLKDGKRIGKDFFLYKDPANKIPLTKNELKSRLGDINEFTDTTREYKAMVNRLLFGFPNLETYDEFIKLLLQLRSNKLSKDYKPTNLINVLNTVLQPLTEEDLRPLADAIEQMNKTKEQVETLEKNSKSLKDFLKVYKNYNEALLLTKARNYKKINDEYKQVNKTYENLKKDLNEISTNLKIKNNHYTEVIQNIQLNNETKQQLDNQDLKQKIEDLSKIKEKVSTLENKIITLTEKINTFKEEELDLNKKIATSEEDIYKLKTNLEEITIDLKDIANNAYFDEIVFFVDELNETLEKETSFDSINLSLKHYHERIKTIINYLEEEQKILLESETTRLEFEKLSNSYKSNEKDLNNLENKLKESIMSWEEDFINKLNNNKYLKLEEPQKKQIFNFINEYSNENYNLAKDIYNQSARELINSIINNNLILENKKAILEQEQLNLQEKYQQLEESKDLELEPINIDTDTKLKENNINFIPLYKCIEFKPEIKETTKNNIESILMDTNILNTKILTKEDLNKALSLNIPIQYLEKTTSKKNNLLKYFNITIDKTSTLKKERIEEILQSISIDPQDQFTIGDNASAKIDALNIISSKNYSQTYIGYQKRLEQKQKQISDLINQIELVKKQISNIQNIILTNNEKISIIESETLNFPSNIFINNIIDQIKETKLSLSWLDKRQKELEQELIKIDNKTKSIKDKINNNKQGLHIPLNIQSYKEVSINLTTINEMLQHLKNIHNTYLNKQEINLNYKNHLEDIINSIEYTTADKNEKQQELNINNNNLATINEILETKEYQNQKEKLLKLEQESIQLAHEKEVLSKEIVSLEKDLEYKSQQEEKLLITVNNVLNKTNIYKEIFLREYKLNYIYNDEITDLDITIKKIIDNGKDKRDFSLTEALTSFYQSYNRYRLELNDYSLRDITLFNDYETTDEKLNNIYKENIRIDISAMYQGIKLNIISLYNKITEDIEESKNLISKQDRHLFEDILLNTVGEKIRKRIESSNDWVNKINNIMATMQENSALSFKLVWKSISANTEEEIDTKELVKILKMDPKLLKPTDADKLTNHFRSKIKKAEELYQDSYISFYKIIEEVLDYRSWFTFQLLYQRKGINPKELTDKTFSKFSGGERAKSMYIPLFASVYAKLNLAKEDSLRIIALDEAFAGVDEENIREMFGILKYLDIDYIINSQVLWGDYDTIDDLSICELIRPQNSQVVTVERYRWNGKYKEIINNKNNYNEEL